MRFVPEERKSMRPTAYMTKSQYELYGAIDKLECETIRLRRAVEHDFRGKHIDVSGVTVLALSDDVEDAMRAWHQEDEDALSVDDSLKVATK